MKKLMTALIVGLSGLLVLSACSQEPPASPAAKPSEQNAAATPSTAMNAETAGRSGTVVETMDAMNYTYIQVDTGTETFWAATSKMPVKVGDAVIVPQGTPMPDFHSKELDRTFEMIYFVSSVMVGDGSAAAAQAGMPEGHPPMTGGSPKVGTIDVDLSGIEKADGGVTVAEIYANKDDLAGQPVKVRGKVVKYSPQIMQKNWLHIQDGSGNDGSNDLTVTTNVEAAVGDTVVVSGVLTKDADFGYGYQYGVIVEDAEVTVE